jgi:hypothetical protein
MCRGGGLSSVFTTLSFPHRLTNSSFANAILSTTVFIVRVATSRLGNSFLYINAFYSVILCILWAACLKDQMSPDYSDAEHPSPRPWYLTRSCCEAQEDTTFACSAAQASFLITTLVVLVYGLRTCLDFAEAMRVWREATQARDGYGDEERRMGAKGMLEVYADKNLSSNKDDYDDTSRAYRYNLHDEQESTGPRHSIQRITDEAWSPVLAFYPADVR